MHGWQKVLGLALLASGLSAATAHAQYGARQYYGPWQYSYSGNYHYRPYYYKLAPTFVGYRHHYVVYRPQVDRRHYYFYNPYKKVYWGRCPSQYDGYSPQQYSLLPDSYRKPSLTNIPENAFPPPRAAPVIPEATDRAQLDLPPDDTPPNGPPQGAPGVPGPPGAPPGVAPAAVEGGPPVTP